MKEPKITSEEIIEEEEMEQLTDDVAGATEDHRQTEAAEEQQPSTALSPLSKFTRNEDAEQSANLSLREILGGDILTARWLRRQIGLIIMCVFFIIIYITNRYSSEQEMIDIRTLKNELQEMKYYALTRSGELTVKTRQSNIEEQLRANGDSTLRMPKEPPFIIKIQVEE